MLIPLAYARRSKKGKGAGLSVRGQFRQIDLLAAALGLSVPERFEDDGISASEYAREIRDGYPKLLLRMAEISSRGDTPCVLAWHEDRVSRKPGELEHEFVKQVIDTGAKVWMVEGGAKDYTTPEGRRDMRRAGADGAYESDHRSARVKIGKEEAALDGLTHGGSRAFGYDADKVTIREDEAEIIRDMVDRVTNGEPLRALARELAEKGVPTVKGAAWTAPALRAVLINPRIAGIRVHRGKEVLAGAHPEIVTEEQFRLCHAVLTAETRKFNPGGKGGAEPKQLGSGLYLCGTCGKKLGASPARRAVAYRCRDGGHVSRTVTDVDTIVVKALLGFITMENVSPRVTTPDTSDLDRKIGVAETQLLKIQAQLTDMDNPMDPAEGAKAVRVWRDRLAEFTRQRALQARPKPMDGVTPDSWEGLPLARRRGILADLAVVTINGVKSGLRPAVVARREL